MPGGCCGIYNSSYSFFRHKKGTHSLRESSLHIICHSIYGTLHFFMGRITTISSFFFHRQFVIRHLSSSLDLCQQLPNKNESQPIVSFTRHWVCIAEWPFWDGHCLTSHYQLKNGNAFLKKCTRSVFSVVKKGLHFCSVEFQMECRHNLDFFPHSCL